jgi:hypothetical protein
MRRALLVFCLVVSGVAAVSQEFVTITSDPNDVSRPISTLINQIRKRERISITDEDPRYGKRADLEDVTAEVSRAPEPEKQYGPRIIVPKGHAITFVYAPSELRSLNAAKKTIERMLQEYASAGGPVFTVTEDELRLHVIPSEVSDSNGVRVRQGSILDTLVAVPAAERDGDDLLQAICDDIQKETGYEVGIGPSVPANYLARYKTSQGISKQTARVAIAHLLDPASVTGIFDWDLYYGPSDKSYMLNFSYAGPAAQPPQ